MIIIIYIIPSVWSCSSETTVLLAPPALLAVFRERERLSCASFPLRGACVNETRLEVLLVDRQGPSSSPSVGGDWWCGFSLRDV